MSTHPDLAAIVAEHFPCDHRALCDPAKEWQHDLVCRASSRGIALRVAVAAARWENERCAQIARYSLSSDHRDIANEIREAGIK